VALGCAAPPRARSDYLRDQTTGNTSIQNSAPKSQFPDIDFLKGKESGGIVSRSRLAHPSVQSRGFHLALPSRNISFQFPTKRTYRPNFCYPHIAPLPDRQVAHLPFIVLQAHPDYIPPGFYLAMLILYRSSPENSQSRPKTLITVYLPAARCFFRSTKEGKIYTPLSL